MTSAFLHSVLSGPRRLTAGFLRAFALAGVVLLSACASDGDDFTVDPAPPAQQLFNEGQAAMEAGRFRAAIDAFEELDRFYPYSELSRQGMVLTAYAAYQMRDYEVAIDTTERFMRLYPASDDAEFILYLQAEAYLRTVPDITRDQAPARQALAADQELLERFPNSQYVAEAQRNIIAIRDQLAGQEMQIGRLHQERRNYVGAVNRFREVVTEYDDTRHVEEALFRLTETYLAMGLVGEAQTAAAVLGHNFPSSTWYQSAYDLLAARGVVPERSSGSWLNGLFSG